MFGVTSYTVTTPARSARDRPCPTRLTPVEAFVTFIDSTTCTPTSTRPRFVRLRRLRGTWTYARESRAAKGITSRAIPPSYRFSNEKTEWRLRVRKRSPDETTGSIFSRFFLPFENRSRDARINPILTGNSSQRSWTRSTFQVKHPSREIFFQPPRDCEKRKERETLE